MTVFCDFYASFASNALKMSVLKHEFLSLLHCWWEFKFAQPLQKTVWRFLRKLKVELPYDPTVPLLPGHRLGQNYNSKRYMQEFPDGPVVRTMCTHCQRPGFNPCQGAKIPHAV